MKDRFIYVVQKHALLRFLILFVLFVFLGSGVSYLKSINKAVPIIKETIPKVFDKNDFITINGIDFGTEAEDSFLKINNIVIPSALCKKWTDNQIILSTNMAGSGGLLFVIAKNSYSLPVFISSRDEIPVVKIKTTLHDKPSIDAVSKDNGSTGHLVKIYGNNFGVVRENSQVVFARGRNDPVLFPFDKKNIEQAVYCSTFDFEFWSNEEIHVRIPDGAISGYLIVATKNGLSNSIPFNIQNEIGEKKLVSGKEYIVSIQTELSNIKSETKNTLFLFSSLPEDSFSQCNLETIETEPQPLVDNHNNVVIHRIDNVKNEDVINIKHKYRVISYEVNTTVNSYNIKRIINNKKIYNHYTNQTSLLPTREAKIKTVLAQIVRNEDNDYVKAKKIYDYINSNFIINRDEVSDRSQNVLFFLDTKKGSPYDAAHLFATLCRCANIPSVVVSGIVIDETSKSYLHWWNEFYIDGFGWIPVDIGMSLAIPFENKVLNKSSYYFGNIDSARISFSHGEKEILQMASNSKVFSHERSFALQSFWEETIGIKSYTCFWQIPQVILFE